MSDFFRYYGAYRRKDESWYVAKVYPERAFVDEVRGKDLIEFVDHANIGLNVTRALGVRGRLMRRWLKVES